MNENLLIKVLGWQSESRKEKEQIIPQLMEYLSSLKFKIQIDQDEHGNIFVTKGKKELYPCLVSHLDDVHTYKENKKIIRNGDFLLAFDGSKQIGTAGDDKVGIAICLQALNDFKCIKLAFFVSEEVGCIGSNACKLDFFSNCMFIGQADRKGNSDFINNSNSVDLFDSEFSNFVKPFLEKFNYKETKGVSTDVGALTKRNVGVATFNISCGYYNPHCFNEYVVISDVKKCYNLIKTIILNCNKQYKYIPVIDNAYYTPSARSVLYNSLYANFKESKYYFSNNKFTFAYGKSFEYFEELLKSIDNYVDSYATDLPYITDIIEEYLMFITDTPSVAQKPITNNTPSLFGNSLTCQHKSIRYDSTMDKTYCMDCFEYVEDHNEKLYNTY